MGKTAIAYAWYSPKSFCGELTRISHQGYLPEIPSRKFMINKEFYSDFSAEILLFDLISNAMVMFDVQHRGFDA